MQGESEVALGYCLSHVSEYSGVLRQLLLGESPYLRVFIALVLSYIFTCCHICFQ